MLLLYKLRRKGMNDEDDAAASSFLRRRRRASRALLLFGLKTIMAGTGAAAATAAVVAAAISGVWGISRSGDEGGRKVISNRSSCSITYPSFCGGARREREGRVFLLKYLKEYRRSSAFLACLSRPSKTTTCHYGRRRVPCLVIIFVLCQGSNDNSSSSA